MFLFCISRKFVHATLLGAFFVFPNISDPTYTQNQLIKIGKKNKKIILILGIRNYNFRNAKRTSHIAGLANGTLMGAFNISLGIAFRYGGYLVAEGEVSIKDLMQ